MQEQSSHNSRKERKSSLQRAEILRQIVAESLCPIVASYQHTVSSILWRLRVTACRERRCWSEPYSISMVCSHLYSQGSEDRGLTIIWMLCYLGVPASSVAAQTSVLGALQKGRDSGPWGFGDSDACLQIYTCIQDFHTASSTN